MPSASARISPLSDVLAIAAHAIIWAKKAGAGSRTFSTSTPSWPRR